MKIGATDIIKLMYVSLNIRRECELKLILAYKIYVLNLQDLQHDK